MRTKCGVEYEVGIEKPPNARFGLWYFGHVKFFSTREEAEMALKGLSAAEKDEAAIGELVTGK
jgi:hypothetical protein